MTERKTPKPKALGVTEEIKREIDALCDISGKNQSQVMDDLWTQFKQEHPDQWKKIKAYMKLKGSL